MIMKADASLKHVADFSAQIQTLDIPGELKVGYSPIGFVRCGRSACRVTKIDWKVHSRTVLPRACHLLQCIVDDPVVLPVTSLSSMRSGAVTSYRHVSDVASAICCATSGRARQQLSSFPANCPMFLIPQHTLAGWQGDGRQEARGAALAQV